MNKNITEQLKRITLTEDLMETEGFSEELAESIVDGLYTPDTPAYICNTPEELTAAIAEMSKKDVKR